MAVEFCSHFCRAYSYIARGTPAARVAIAFEETGAPLFGGFSSTCLAIIWLSFSKFDFIEVYFFQMFALMTLISFFNGIFLLPVLCQTVGPGAFSAHQIVSINAIGRAWHFRNLYKAWKKWRLVYSRGRTCGMLAITPNFAGCMFSQCSRATDSGQASLGEL